MPDDNQPQPLTGAEFAVAMAEARAEIRGAQDRALEFIAAEIRGAQDRALDSIAAEFSPTREGFSAELDRRFTAVDRRLDRMETTLIAVQMQTAGMSKSLSDAE